LTGKSFLTLPESKTSSPLPALTIAHFESPAETMLHRAESTLETPSKPSVTVVDIALSEETPKAGGKSPQKTVSPSKNSVRKISGTINDIEKPTATSANEFQASSNTKLALDKKQSPSKTISNLTPKQRESISASRKSLFRTKDSSPSFDQRTPDRDLSSIAKSPIVNADLETPKSKKSYSPNTNIQPHDGEILKPTMFSKLLSSPNPVFGQVSPSYSNKHISPESMSSLKKQHHIKEKNSNADVDPIALTVQETNSLPLSISGVSYDVSTMPLTEIRLNPPNRPRSSSEVNRKISLGRVSVKKRQESLGNVLLKGINSFHVNISIPLKKRLEDLYGALLDLNSPLEQATATLLLKCLFRLEGGEVICF
jgi:hypothetical protein